MFALGKRALLAAAISSMMALKPEFVGARTVGNSGTVTSTRQITPLLPVGTQAGDLAILLITTAGNRGSTNASFITNPPGGWLPLARRDSSGNSRSSYQLLYRLLQPGDSVSSVSSVFALNCNQLACTLHVWRNATWEIPDFSVVWSTGNNTATSITVPEGAAMSVFGSRGGYSAAPVVNSYPAQTTFASEEVFTGGQSSSLLVWTGYEQDLPEGATGNRGWSIYANNGTVNVLVGIRAAKPVPPFIVGGYKSPEVGAGSFTVPAGVYSICALIVGAGGGGASGGNGGSGVLVYNNHIAVTPGDVLTYQVGEGKTYQTESAICQSWVKKSGVTIMRADYGKGGTPTTAPGYGNPGAGGSYANSIGEVIRSGKDGDSGGDDGYSFNEALTYRPSGSIGAGRTGYNVNGNNGIVIFIWGLGRAFSGADWF